MAITIKEIRNLTNTAIDPITEANKLKDFKPQNEFATTIINEKATLGDWDGFAPTDNIQVTWNNGQKAIYRGVGGTLKKEGEADAGKGKITISGLINVTKYSINLNGQIAIGEEGVGKDAALISVSIGNMISKDNPMGDTIIDLSDRTYADEGTNINLTALLSWIQGQDKGSEKPTLPAIEKDGKPMTTDDFIIEFKAFHFNTTQTTFDIDVRSSEGSEITFGNLTIKQVGFRVTNEAITLPATKEA